LFEALNAAKSELLYRDACAGRHDTEADVRGPIVDVLSTPPVAE